MISSWVMWKSDFHMAHVEIWFLFTSATGDFTNFLKMYGNFSMTITYTNSYRNIYLGQLSIYGWCSLGMKKFPYLKNGPFGNCIFLYELLAMAIEKFPYIFKKFVKSLVALVKRNQISTWVMWKSDFHMTHGEIIFILLLFDKFFGHVEIWFPHDPCRNCF